MSNISFGAAPLTFPRVSPALPRCPTPTNISSSFEQQVHQSLPLGRKSNSRRIHPHSRNSSNFSSPRRIYALHAPLHRPHFTRCQVIPNRFPNANQSQIPHHISQKGCRHLREDHLAESGEIPWKTNLGCRK